jgi:hypothetical protein
MRLARLVLALAVASGCDSTMPVAPQDMTVEDSPPLLVCTCQPTQGCMYVHVTVTPSSSVPFTNSVAGADGVGDLDVAVLKMGALQTFKTVSADFRAPTASYDVDVGCLDAGPYTVNAFLDDNQNEPAMATSSSDPVDSCSTNSGSPPVTIQAAHIYQVVWALSKPCP